MLVTGVRERRVLTVGSEKGEHCGVKAAAGLSANSGEQPSAWPRITVVVPVRDEESTVADALRSLARQTVGPSALEVLVYDGGSEDRTAEICRGIADAWPWGRFEVLDNPARTVPPALNAGLAEGHGEWFAVLAGRTELAPNYLEACLEELERSGPLVAAGGRFVAEARGPVAGAIAAVVTHPFGVGRGFRTETAAADLPHHPFAVWRRSDVVQLGGFKEELQRNQDDEFSMRALEHGARIRLVPETTVRYRPRERYRGLAAQYFQYGLWKSAVGVRYGRFPVRSALPALSATGLAAGVALAASGRTRIPLVVLAGAYVLAGSTIAVKRGSSPPLTTLALALVHLSYGAGIIAGLARPGLVASAFAQARVR
jgi:succinoglycan biosynthesis protein ExoA